MILLALVAVMVFAACAQEDAPAETATAGKTEAVDVELESEADVPVPLEEAGAPPVNPEITEDTAADASEYMEWTKAEWDQASREDKEICALNLVVTLDSEIVAAPEEEFNGAIAGGVEQLDQLYEANPTKTLREIIDSQA
jgi:hypothetical protein